MDNDRRSYEVYARVDTTLFLVKKCSLFKKLVNDNYVADFKMINQNARNDWFILINRFIKHVVRVVWLSTERGFERAGGRKGEHSGG